VFGHRHFDCRQRAGDSLGDRWPGATVDKGGGEVKQEIDDFRVFILRMGREKSFEKFLEAWTNPVQIAQTGEQGCEDVWPHAPGKSLDLPHQSLCW
jgi:hypothetical protein